MGGFSFCDPRADSQDVLPPKVSPSRWPRQGTFRWRVQVSGPALSQSRKALARLAELHQLMLDKWVHREWDEMDVTPSAPAPLMTRSHSSRGALLVGKPKEKERKEFLLFLENPALSLSTQESSSVCVWNMVSYIAFLSLFCLASLPCFFLFFSVKGQVIASEPLSQELTLKVQMKLMTRDNILMLIRYFVCLSSSEQYCSFMYYMKAEL